jgi:hypothetical protein
MIPNYNLIKKSYLEKQCFHDILIKNSELNKYEEVTKSNIENPKQMKKG